MFSVIPGEKVLFKTKVSFLYYGPFGKSSAVNTEVLTS